MPQMLWVDVAVVEHTPIHRQRHHIEELLAVWDQNNAGLVPRKSVSSLWQQQCHELETNPKENLCGLAGVMAQ